MRKETIELVFADAKEKHAMCFTHHRSLARVANRVRLKYAAMNLKSWQNGVGTALIPAEISQFLPQYVKSRAFA